MFTESYGILRVAWRGWNPCTSVAGVADALAGDLGIANVLSDRSDRSDRSDMRVRNQRTSVGNGKLRFLRNHP